MRTQAQALVNGQVFDAINQQSILVPVSGILTAGSPADIGAINIPWLRYQVVALILWSPTATGSLALATIDLRTAAGGAGSSVLPAPTALANITGPTGLQNIPAAQLVIQTAPTLTLRQTVNSGNTGNISGVVVVQPLP